jgi:hypothetical protein
MRSTIEARAILRGVGGTRGYSLENQEGFHGPRARMRKGRPQCLDGTGERLPVCQETRILTQLVNPNCYAP